MGFFRVFFLIAGLIVFSSVCAFSEERYDIKAFGDHSLWVLVNDIKDDFRKDTGITLHLIPELAVSGKGCAKGILHAASGVPGRDAGLVCCDLKKEIIKEYGLKVYPVTVEPLAIIVNKKNPVKGLTLREVRDIFSGKVTNWKEVGGPNEPIAVITRLHCPEHIANWTRILPADKFTSKRLNVQSEPDMARTVSDFTQAIGHLEMTSVMEAGHRVKALPVDGYMPTSENLRAGLYPFSTRLSVVTKGEAEGRVLKFIEYMRTSPRAMGRMLRYGMHQTGN